ncbi:hypothetical protein ACA910_011865 [Epithemia clementina (nom. ined.)]
MIAFPKVIVALLLAASCPSATAAAASFVQSPTSSSSIGSSTNHHLIPKTTTRLFASGGAFENELGAQPPLGFLDPLGLVKDGDVQKFDRLRYVELKHGRISMLAVVGYLVTEAGLRFPGDIDLRGTSFDSIPSGWSALSAVPPAGLIQMIAFVGFLDLIVMKDIVGSDIVGDFRNDFIDYGWETFDEETKFRKRGIELNQGRAAMMGILALMVHEQLGVPILPQ